MDRWRRSQFSSFDRVIECITTTRGMLLLWIDAAIPSFLSWLWRLTDQGRLHGCRTDSNFDIHDTTRKESFHDDLDAKRIKVLGPILNGW